MGGYRLNCLKAVYDMFVLNKILTFNNPNGQLKLDLKGGYFPNTHIAAVNTSSRYSGTVSKNDVMLPENTTQLRYQAGVNNDTVSEDGSTLFHVKWIEANSAQLLIYESWKSKVWLLVQIDADYAFESKGVCQRGDKVFFIMLIIYPCQGRDTD